MGDRIGLDFHCYPMFIGLNWVCHFFVSLSILEIQQTYFMPFPKSSSGLHNKCYYYYKIILIIFGIYTLKKKKKKANVLEPLLIPI